MNFWRNSALIHESPSHFSASNLKKLSALNVDSSERQKATEALVNFAAQYEAAFTAINQNTALPTDFRNALITHLILSRASNFELIEQLYNVDLNWSTTGGLLA